MLSIVSAMVCNIMDPQWSLTPSSTPPFQSVSHIPYRSEYRPLNIDEEKVTNRSHQSGAKHIRRVLMSGSKSRSFKTVLPAVS